jgi:antitoxin (DNA-binding transcriptional repressor) of toxin-antitoxin stability system
METMAISEFKARCLAALERVRRTGRPLLVTRFGKPVAQIDPAPASGRKRWLGAMQGKGRIVGDLVSPLGAEGWEALRK